MSTPAICAKPSEIGLDVSRLHRIDDHFRHYVDNGQLAGWLIAVMRHGELAHFSTYGHRDREANEPVTADTIWRIYSMTKPITAVAAMMLWEEGKFELKDAVSKFIPSFAEQKVWRNGSTAKYFLDPVVQQMEIWHLLTHTSGLTYGFMMAHPVDALYRDAGFDWGIPTKLDLAATCDRLASLPLLFQPGTEWNYSMATDVLGRVVEVASGMSLDEFFRTRIFEPLGMTDTAFSVSADKAHRLAALYGAKPSSLEAMRLETAGKAALHPPAAWLGGGGLMSTAPDYLRFAEMLRRGGELDGARLLAPSTVRYMASNHLPGNVDLSEFGRPLFAETTYDGVGFGLGMSVTIDPIKAKIPGSIGEFGWGGAASTTFSVDPVQDTSVLLMTQLLPSSTHPLRSELKQLVQQAIVD